MIGNIWDWVIVIVVALILFGGANKIPELFRSMGRAAGEFKRGQMEIEREIQKEIQSGKADKTESNNK
jgi:sec-independent protein translocase protein TatA